MESFEELANVLHFPYWDDSLVSLRAGIGGLPEAIGVTVSIGLAVHDPGDTFASLLKRSDDALYCAKRSGRNRVSMALV